MWTSLVAACGLPVADSVIRLAGRPMSVSVRNTFSAFLRDVD